MLILPVVIGALGTAVSAVFGFMRTKSVWTWRCIYLVLATTLGPITSLICEWIKSKIRRKKDE